MSDVLMKEGTWTLKQITEVPRMFESLHSYIIHDCPVCMEKRFWWILAVIDEPCMRCKERPPAHLLALWKLHNWNYIQGGGD